MHVVTLTYDQNTVGVNSCSAPSCNAQFQLVLPMTTDTTYFASSEGSALGHVAWGSVVMAAWSCAAADVVAAVGVVDAVVAAAAADWSVGAENREAVLAVVAVVAAATTRLGDAVAPATTGALGDSIERESRAGQNATKPQ
jgi:predicted small integral membrane protein